MREHLGQGFQNAASGRCVYLSQHFDQSFFIHSSYLVEHNLPFFSLKRCADPRWVLPACCCHWSDDDCPDKPVHLIRGDNQTGPSFFDFMSEGGIQVD